MKLAVSMRLDSASCIDTVIVWLPAAVGLITLYIVNVTNVRFCNGWKCDIVAIDNAKLHVTGRSVDWSYEKWTVKGIIFYINFTL